MCSRILVRRLSESHTHERRPSTLRCRSVCVLLPPKSRIGSTSSTMTGFQREKNDVPIPKILSFSLMERRLILPSHVCNFASSFQPHKFWRLLGKNCEFCRTSVAPYPRILLIILPSKIAQNNISFLRNTFLRWRMFWGRLKVSNRRGCPQTRSH